MYDAIGRHIDTISGPYDLVFTVYNAQLATIDNHEVQKLVTDLLRRAGVIGRPAKAAHGIVKSTNTEGNA